MKIVKIHNGNMHVRGRARKYSYLVCSLFETHLTKSGYYIWKNTGIHTKARRGEGVCVRDGEELAKKHNCLFNNNYGSLHNKKVKVEI